jgi:cytochrome c oxidase assembly protein subunit 15
MTDPLSSPLLSSSSIISVIDSTSLDDTLGNSIRRSVAPFEMHSREAVPDRLLKTLSFILVGGVIFLIFVGGLVKSHEAGLSVPDWPTTYGENMFLFPYEKWIGGIYYEHGHRLLASVVGFITVCLAVATLFRERRWLPRLLSIVAVLTVILQGVLGGLTVWYQLPPAISIAHGLLAQTFFLLTISLAYLQSTASFSRNEAGLSDGTPPSSEGLRSLRSFAIGVVVTIYLQLIAGAVMRHNGAGMALLDFPTMGGSYLPSLSSSVIAHANELRASVGLPAVGLFPVALHLIHRVGGMIVVIAVALLLCRVHPFSTQRTLQLPALTIRAGKLLGGLTVVQFGLGVVSILTVREPLLTSLHVAVGAAVLGSAFVMVLSLYQPRGTFRQE